jgi:lipopolysaccharide export system protein LptA
MRRTVAWGLAAALFLGGQAAAQDAAKPAKELRLSVRENRIFRFEKDLVTIKGLIELVQGEVRLWTGEIVYDTKKKTAVLSGGAKLLQDDLTLSADQFSAAFEEERYAFQSGVKLVKKEKEAEKGDKLVLQADRLDYDAEARSLVATGNVQVKEKKRTATARTVEYRDKESRLVLEGTVVIKEEDDKTIRGERIIVDLDRDLVEVEGPVEADFRL